MSSESVITTNLMPNQTVKYLSHLNNLLLLNKPIVPINQKFNNFFNDNLNSNLSINYEYNGINNKTIISNNFFYEKICLFGKSKFY